MRLYNLAMLCASGALLAAPTFAQSNGTAVQKQQSGMILRPQLVQDLQRAGFTNIRVSPEVFVVHAKNSQGDPIVMRIGPDSMEAVTTVPANNAGP
jgi:hypothetical protein